MKNPHALNHRSTLALCIGLGAALTPFAAYAQDEPKPEAAPTPAPETPAAAPPAAAPAAAAAPAPAPEAATPPPAPAAAKAAEAAPTPPPDDAPPPPPPAEEKLPSIDVGAWLRVGVRFQNDKAPTQLNDQQLDTVYGELHVGGKVHKNVSYTFNFNANALGPDGKQGSVGLMDAIIGLDFEDALHLWSGQLLVPSDRANFSGPFFMTPWNYPGVYSVPGSKLGGFVGPAEGPAGRNVGSVVWGDFGQGLFKYYAGAFHLNNVDESPLFSGRLNFSPIGKEPGFYHSGTYYGEKDILAIGVGGQTQKNGGATDKGAVANFSEFNADALAEFKIGDAGAISGEGAYYHFGNYGTADDGFLLLASYLSPKVGIGKLQPMIRYQAAMKKATPAGDVTMSVLDAALAYVINGPNLRVVANFQHTDLGVDKVRGNAIQIGLQTIQF